MRSVIVSESLFAAAPQLHEGFVNAKPFPHVVIDEFFDSAFARDLVDQFPAAAEATRNLYGAPGQKAFHRDLTSLGSAYRAVHDFFASREFLDWAGRITGVPHLVYDESNYGGGTHENFDGRDLRPHVDFNYHPVIRLHRRVNLIVYLNEGWLPQWGGSIALHSDPRDPLDNVIEYAPLFNRCIIFETSERSWHGFDRISLPKDERHRSRKSLSIYLYSRERPEHEVHREHTTFFIPRPLPPRFVSGYTLSEDDAAELGELVGQRDRLIELYQREQGARESDSAQAARLRMAFSQIAAHHSLPLMGYASVLSGVDGLHPDGWTGAQLRFTLRAERPMHGIAVRAIVPQSAPASTVLALGTNGEVRAQSSTGPGIKEMTANIVAAAGEAVEIHIAANEPIEFFVERIVCEHSA